MCQSVYVWNTSEGCGINDHHTQITGIVYKQSTVWDFYQWTYMNRVSLVARLVKNLPATGRPGFNPWVKKIHWRREGVPTPVFWPGEFHGLYSPRGRKESDTTEQLSLSPWTVTHQAPLSMKFPRQEYWSGLPFPTSGDLPDPMIKPTSLVSPALADGFFTTVHLGSPYSVSLVKNINV